MGLFSSIGKLVFGSPAKSSQQTSGTTNQQGTQVTSGTNTNTGTTNSVTNGTSTTNPYAAAEPYLSSYLSNINNLYSTNSGISGQEQQGYDALGSVAGDQSSINGAIAANNKIVNGDYMTVDSNPYLKDIATRISGIAGSNANATFGGMGRSGGGLAGYYNGQAVGDSLTNLYGQEYDSERARQQAAIAQSVGLDNQRYVAPNALIAAGTAQSSRPFDLAAQQGGLLAQIAGLGSTTTNNSTTNGTINTTGTNDSVTNSSATGNTTGTASGTSSAQSNGIFGSLINSLFPNSYGTGSSGSGGSSLSSIAKLFG